MSINKKRLYTTGELAKMFSIKKDTLFYYDRIGLFSPKHRDSKNNYRYYDSGQIMVLDTILSLRDIDISIDELRTYLNDMNTESFLKLMQLKEQKLESIIKDFSLKKRTITELAKRMKIAKECKKEEVFIENRDIQNYFALPIINTGLGIEEDWDKTYLNLWDYLEADNIVTIGSILPQERFLDNDYEDVSHVIGYTIGKSNAYAEKGLYAYLYSEGSYDLLNDSYKNFQSSLLSKGYIPISNIYEEYVISSLSEKDESKYITKISVRVKMSE